MVQYSQRLSRVKGSVIREIFKMMADPQIISLGGGSGSFIVDAYPVSVHVTDVILIFITVIAVGFLSVWYPVHYLTRRLLKK